MKKSLLSKFTNFCNFSHKRPLDRLYTNLKFTPIILKILEITFSVRIVESIRLITKFQAFNVDLRCLNSGFLGGDFHKRKQVDIFSFYKTI